MLSNLISKLRHWQSPMAEFVATEAEGKSFADSEGSDLARIFFTGVRRRIHKWVHYLPIYERYFHPFRGTPLRILEIGVFGGGSLEMWREYFGSTATIYGIDINPDCAGLADSPNQIRIGSQDDPDFLRSVVEEMGGLDVVLDDGSHIGKHQRASFHILFPLLKEGGLYVIEDTHTSYWFRYRGGYRRRGTAIEFAKQIVDDLHGWYHGRSTKTSARDDVGSVHFHDSIIVIEKRSRQKPKHIIVG